MLWVKGGWKDHIAPPSCSGAGTQCLAMDLAVMGGQGWKGPSGGRHCRSHKGISIPAGNEAGSLEGQGSCHVHLHFMCWNLAPWGGVVVGYGEAMPERLKEGHVSPRLGQDMLIAHSPVGPAPPESPDPTSCIFSLWLLPSCRCHPEFAARPWPLVP